jgi:hypothetical protein
MVLAVLGVVFLLLNPAGICAGAGIASTESPSHPCCPKPPAGKADSPCICIDRQPAAPTVPSLTDQTPFAAIEPSPAVTAAIPVQTPEFCAFEVPAPAPHAILLSTRQLLL